MTLMINARHLFYGHGHAGQVQGHRLEEVLSHLRHVRRELFHQLHRPDAPEGWTGAGSCSLSPCSTSFYWFSGSTLGGLFGSLHPLQHRGAGFCDDRHVRGDLPGTVVEGRLPRRRPGGAGGLPGLPGGSSGRTASSSPPWRASWPCWRRPGPGWSKRRTEHDPNDPDPADTSPSPRCVLGTMCTRFLPFLVFPRGPAHPKISSNTWAGCCRGRCSGCWWSTACGMWSCWQGSHGLPEALSIAVVAALHLLEKADAALHRGGHRVLYAAGAAGVCVKQNTIVRKKARLKSRAFLAGLAGVEPTMGESKSPALPLGDSPIRKKANSKPT